MGAPSVRHKSDCFVRPKHAVDESTKPIYLPPWDLAMVSVHYIQKGLMFVKPPQAYTYGDDFMAPYLGKLKDSLSLALVHFYPLSGRLKTIKTDDPHFYTVYIDCVDSPGARFIHATLDMTVSDILSPVYVPEVVLSLFDHDRASNHDGHTKSLLTIQVTELVDGVFIGCSFNHAVGDGSSYWHFFNAWSEIYRALEKGCYNNVILNPPVLRRWFPDGSDVPINLPFTDPSQFVGRYDAPILKERVFHFSAETIARLKHRANKECGRIDKTDEISSFKALTAFIWIAIIKARRFPDERITGCRMAANNRPRMCNPGLPPYYFGNCITPVRASTTTSELLRGGLGAAAQLLHVALAEHNSEKINGWLQEWIRKPIVYNIARIFDPDSVMMGSSPRFDKYGNEFGLGKAVALRSGYAHKFDGKVSAYPGRGGGGSIDLEICLLPENMTELEADQEFMDAVTF